MYPIIPLTSVFIIENDENKKNFRGSQCSLRD
jgi:hypothetical protein